MILAKALFYYFLALELERHINFFKLSGLKLERD